MQWTEVEEESGEGLPIWSIGWLLDVNLGSVEPFSGPHLCLYSREEPHGVAFTSEQLKIF